MEQNEEGGHQHGFVLRGRNVPDGAGAGLIGTETQTVVACPGAAREQTPQTAGHFNTDSQKKRAGNGEGGGQSLRETQSNGAAVLAELRGLHRQRVFAIEQRKRLDNGLGALLRTQLGWSLALPAKERAAIAARAKALIKAARDPEAADPELETWRTVILAAWAGRAPFDGIQKSCEKQMSAVVKTLPIWPWAEAVKGLGPVGLAGLLAETGDVAGYATVSRLWKRMGLAVIAGKAQGRPGAKASKADWIEHAYSKRRRSLMWNIGQNLIRCGGDYYQVYLDLKRCEMAAARAAGLGVAPAAKIPAAAADSYRSEGHIHNRAQRRMEKRFLRDLWVAWRAAEETS